MAYNSRTKKLWRPISLEEAERRDEALMEQAVQIAQAGDPARTQKTFPVPFTPDASYTTPTPQPETPASVGSTQTMSETKTTDPQTPDYLKPFTYGAAPVWSGSTWDDKYKAAVDAALGMNYTDWTQGADYAALADRYANQGQRAVQDVLGQLAARTGGVASSYAVTAAQQQYNDYMAQLEEVARQMYENQRGEKLDAVGMLQSLTESDYDRYRDELSRYNTDRNFAYDTYADDRNFQYGREMDQLSVDRTREQDAADRVQAFFAAGGKAADLPAELKAAAGYSDAELNAMQSYYEANGITNLGGLTEQDAQAIRDYYGTSLYADQYDALLKDFEAYGITNEWLKENGIVRAPGLSVDESYTSVAKAAEKAGLDAPMTRSEYEANAAIRTQYDTYSAYLSAYEEYIEDSKNT